MTYRQPGTVLTDHLFAVPLDHGRPDGRADRGVRPRGGRRRQGRRRPAVAAVPAGRPGIRRARGRRAGRAGWTGRWTTTGCCCSTSAAPAGPPRRPGRPWPAWLGPRRRPTTWRTSGPTPSCADAELIRRELTGGAPWSVLGQSFGGFCTRHLPVARPGRHPRGVHHRRPARPATSRRRRLPADLSAGARRRTPRTTSATPTTWSRRRRSPGTWPRQDVRLPDGAPLTVRGVPVARAAAGHAAPAATSCTTCWRTRSPATSCPTRSATRSQADAHLRRRPAVRAAARGRATRRGPRPAGPRSGSGPSSRRSTPGRGAGPATSRCCSPAR